MANNGITADGSGGIPPWWGAFRVSIGRTARWRIGPMALVVQRLQHEWRIGAETVGDPKSRAVESMREEAPEAFERLEEVRRFAVSDASEMLRLAPRLADRAVVAQPDSPFFIAAEASVTIYVGTPLWIAINRGPAPGLPLEERPIHRPSDTWFGPTTEGGELSYASRTFCRTHVEDVPQLPHRAVTSVRIRNEADTALAFERINIPVHKLALFRARDGRLWTESLDFVRKDDSDFAEVSFDDEPPSVDAAPTRLSEPRVPRGNLVVRAFSSFMK